VNKSDKLKGGQAAVQALKKEKTKHVFGLIGSATIEIFDALYHEKTIKFIGVRDERTGTHMADGYARALCYQLFENNGVIKRELIDQITKNIPKEDRIILRKAGIKIGRYHIFLPKMLKPNAVDLRVKLWKLYYPDDKKNIIPKSGLNFLNNESEKNKKFHPNPKNIRATI